MIVNIFKDKTLYFDSYDSERCYTIKGMVNQMLENSIDSMELFLAERKKDNDYFYCHEVGEIGEKSEANKVVCIHCYSESVLEWQDKYQCRRCWFMWNKK